MARPVSSRTALSSISRSNNRRALRSDSFARFAARAAKRNHHRATFRSRAPRLWRAVSARHRKVFCVCRDKAPARSSPHLLRARRRRRARLTSRRRRDAVGGRLGRGAMRGERSPSQAAESAPSSRVFAPKRRRRARGRRFRRDRGDGRQIIRRRLARVAAAASGLSAFGRLRATRRRAPHVHVISRPHVRRQATESLRQISRSASQTAAIADVPRPAGLVLPPSARCSASRNAVRPLAT